MTNLRTLRIPILAAGATMFAVMPPASGQNANLVDLVFQKPGPALESYRVREPFTLNGTPFFFVATLDAQQRNAALDTVTQGESAMGVWPGWAGGAAAKPLVGTELTGGDRNLWSGYNLEENEWFTVAWRIETPEGFEVTDLFDVEIDGYLMNGSNRTFTFAEFSAGARGNVLANGNTIGVIEDFNVAVSGKFEIGNTDHNDTTGLKKLTMEVRSGITDADDDNLEDSWETSWPAIGNLGVLDGSKPAGSGPGTGSGDYDGDGLSDLSEQAAGTDPTDPNDPVPPSEISVTGIELADPNLTLTFESVPGFVGWKVRGGTNPATLATDLVAAGQISIIEIQPGVYQCDWSAAHLFPGGYYLQVTAP